MPLGSSSAAPVIKPGPSCRNTWTGSFNMIVPRASVIGAALQATAQRSALAPAGNECGQRIRVSEDNMRAKLSETARAGLGVAVIVARRRGAGLLDARQQAA